MTHVQPRQKAKRTRHSDNYGGARVGAGRKPNPRLNLDDLKHIHQVLDQSPQADRDLTLKLHKIIKLEQAKVQARQNRLAPSGE